MPPRLFRDFPLVKATIGATLIRTAETYAARQLPQNDLDLLVALRAHLLTATSVCNWVDDAVATDSPLIHPKNAERHITYPFNTFTGALIDLGSSDATKLGSQRAVTNERIHASCIEIRRRLLKNVERSSRQSNLVKQHAVHLLAKHGDPGHQENVRIILANPNEDIFVKRMAYAGLALGRMTGDGQERFLHELSRNDRLPRVMLAFDAVHYGDAGLNDGQLPADCRSFRNTIVNALRNMRHTTGYRVNLIGLFKLTSILATVGR